MSSMADDFGGIIALMKRTFGERVRDLRKARGWSQPYLGRFVGISKSAISQIENGETTYPRPETLFELAKAFGVDPKWLMDGEPFYSEKDPIIQLLREMTPDQRKVADYLITLVHSTDPSDLHKLLTSE